ncbi:MAG: DNA recombination protein RmuC [Sphaerochaetaceae bacterium]|nr:DNA recombination protein RmuC [Sphaerochaetaceae bacterium]
MDILLYICLSLLIVIIVLLSLLISKASKNKNDETLSSLAKDVALLGEKTDQNTKQTQFLYTMVDKNLREMRISNEKQLSEMRETVNEKLQQTLENRLSTTFKAVSGQLESVYRQLGEMQNLAKGMDNLERVLTNVKTRGMWGELQAEKILQDILLPEQYLKNVKTKSGSNAVVEFAVKLPENVLLPIDSKFPLEDYERLCEATASADIAGVKAARKALETAIRTEAKRIQDKYIDVPHTTDFAVMFLPIEGLYAEVLSVPGLQELAQRENHILIAGPSTLASLLNSLQMGFRTLAIEKKSAEVWTVLGQVKTQFFKFEDVLKKVQEKLNSASSEVEKAFVRNRVLGSKLKGVETFEGPEELTQDFEEEEER